MYLDATIQRFEFCFELAWKLMKTVLEYEGIEANSPRSCIREGGTGVDFGCGSVAENDGKMEPVLAYV